MPEISLARQKVDALTQSENADLIITVGSCDLSGKQIYASKVHLFSASNYFKDKISKANLGVAKILFKDEDDVNDLDVIILTVEFATLGGYLLDEVDDLEMCVRLATKADKFSFPELGNYCIKLLSQKFLSVDNFWPTFDRYHNKSPSVFLATQEFLVENSLECLEHLEFLKISEASFSTFLKNPNLHVDSEVPLIKACLRYAHHNSADGMTQIDLFQRLALRHLRLYNLTNEELDSLSLEEYLDSYDVLHLTSNLAPCGLDRILEPAAYRQLKPVRFAVQKIPRKPKTQTKLCFIREDSIPTIDQQFDDDCLNVCWYNGKFYLAKGPNRFVMSFKAPRAMQVVEFEILQPLRICHFNLDDIKNCAKNGPRISRWQLPSSVKINGNYPMKLVRGQESPWASWQTSTSVKKDEVLTVEIIYDQPCFHRKSNMSFDDTFSGIAFQFRMFHKPDAESDCDWTELFDNEVNVFKAMSFYNA